MARPHGVRAELGHAVQAQCAPRGKHRGAAALAIRNIPQAEAEGHYYVAEQASHGGMTETKQPRPNPARFKFSLSIFRMIDRM